MDRDKIQKLLIENDIVFTENTSLKQYTTWKIGGNADFLVLVKHTIDVLKICKLCRLNNIPLTILGHGSNVLISDQGIRGVVIINHSIELSVISENKIPIDQQKTIKPRLEFSKFSEVDYFEEKTADVFVKVSSGAPLSYVINNLIEKGITGLQWFAGIPGTIGGAVYNNIHGGSHFFSEYLYEITVLTPSGEIIDHPSKNISFDYDNSSFQKNKEIILEITLVLNKGNKEKALEAVKKWISIKKEVQPFNSAGCCFKNLSQQDKVKYGLPTVSWGYIIDNILKLKGKRIGDAKISEKHSAFIENVGQASSKDVLELIDLIYTTAKDKIRVTPKTEIFLLGFDNKDIEHLL